MKKSNLFKFSVVMGLFFVIQADSFSQRVQNSTPKPNVKSQAVASKADVKAVREPFPKLADFAKTSNSVDEYNKAKSEWIQKYPDAYKKMLENKTITVVTREELNKLPAERAAYIKNHPDLYEIK